MTNKIPSIFFILFPASVYVILHLVSCQNVTITKSFEGNYVCPGEKVILTCITNGSVAVAWISDEYIDPETNGIQLEFGSTDPVGHTEMSTINPNTFAELTRKEGNRVIESQLHITVSKDIPTANITCSDIGHGLSSSFTFELPCKCNLFYGTCYF
jgi:hypothetical protein